MNPMGCEKLEDVGLEVQTGWAQLAKTLLTNYKTLERNTMQGNGK